MINSVINIYEAVTYNATHVHADKAVNQQLSYVFENHSFNLFAG